MTPADLFASDRHVVILADRETAALNGLPLPPGDLALMCSEAIGFDPDLVGLLEAHLAQCRAARCRYVVPKSLQSAFAAWVVAHPELDIVLYETVGGQGAVN